MIDVDLAQIVAVDLDQARDNRCAAPASRRVTVVFPEPLRPTRPNTLPSGMLNETRSSAGEVAPG